MPAGKPQNNAAESESAAAAGEYIALELSRLARIASANGFALLPYLIDMAVLEAWREASEPEDRSHAVESAAE